MAGLVGLVSENLVHVGFAIGALAFLLRDVLWLRVVAILSYAIFTVVALRNGADAAWKVLPWYALFMGINIVRAGLIAYERHLWRFTPDEAELHARAFPMLAREPAKRLMACGQWENPALGERLTREGEFAPKVRLVASGRVRVTLAGELIVDLGPGQFVGEIGFIARRPASATATAVAGDDGEPPRFLTWEVAALRRRLAKDGALRATLETGSAPTWRARSPTRTSGRAGSAATPCSERPAWPGWGFRRRPAGTGPVMSRLVRGIPRSGERCRSGRG